MGKMVNNVVKKVGEVEMSRRSFLKLSLFTAVASYEGLDTVCETLNEMTEPSTLERIMNFLNMDFFDQMAIKWAILDHELSTLIKISKKVDQFVNWLVD